MSTTENTNAIDGKKTEEHGLTPNFKQFAYNYIQSIVLTIGVLIFIVGGLGLYTTKVAQANILPDDIDLAPYTVFDRAVNDIPIDINIMRTSFWSDNTDTFSQKIKFNSQEYLDSFSGSFLCSLKKSADSSSSSFANAPLFFSFVYDNIVAKNFLVINTIFFYLSYLPESFIMILYGFFGIFLWLILYFYNICISIFYHFINIPQLFRNVSDDGKQWESGDNISFFRITKLIMFFFIWMPIGFLSTFLMPIFFTLYALISPLTASYTILKTNKSNGAFDFIKNTFAYKKFLFFILATISLLSNALKYLGSSSIIGIVIAIGFAYFMGLYSNDVPEVGTDNFTAKIRQTTKQASTDTSSKNLVEICSPIPIVDEKLVSKTKGKQYRKLYRAKNIGGNADELNDTSFFESATPDTTPDTTDPNLEDIYSDDGVKSREQLIKDLFKTKDQVTEAQPTLETQVGGKKLKIKGIKKYNIRLV